MYRLIWELFVARIVERERLARHWYLLEDHIARVGSGPRVRGAREDTDSDEWELIEAAA